jgi:hypothetical protein
MCKAPDMSPRPSGTSLGRCGVTVKVRSSSHSMPMCKATV